MTETAYRLATIITKTLLLSGPEWHSYRLSKRSIAKPLLYRMFPSSPHERYSHILFKSSSILAQAGGSRVPVSQ